MIVAGVLIEGVEALAIVESIGIVVKLFQTFFSLDDQQKGVKAQIDQQLDEGPFSKYMTYNDHKITDEELCVLLSENILKIDRHCQSIWKYVPSGLASIFTWTFSGQTTRHEFIIIETENHIGVMEMLKRTINEQEMYRAEIQWWACENNLLKENKRTKILEKRPYDRCLNSLVLAKQEQLFGAQLYEFINIILFCWKKINDKSPKFTTFDPCRKVSKLLARSIFYFSQPNPDYDWIMQSIFGCFTDKPMHIPHFDMILIEKLLWHGQQISDDVKMKIGTFKEIIKNIRNSSQQTQQN